MSRAGLVSVGLGLWLLLGGCVGHLEFDPAASQKEPSGSGGAPGTGGAAMGSGGNTVSGSGGSSGSDGGAAAETTPAIATCPQGFNVLTAVFANKCGGCHGAASPSKNLDTVSAGLGARMVNKVSSCMGKPLIAPTLDDKGKPTGLLFEKLAGPITGCGGKMPVGGSLTDTEMVCVEEWAVGAVNKAQGN